MFTNQQKQALAFNDNNMLVSASAGSGKTTVMVRKILDYLERGSITKIIVLTFTKASAGDMREKLTKELSALIRKEGEHADHYREQLRLMPFAYIGTIDSVCGQIYKRYFEELGLSPTLEMLDAEESKSLRSIAIDEVFLRRIKEEDEDFNELALLYANAKSFKGLKETVEILLNFLSAQENPDEYLNFAIEEAQKPFLESKAIRAEMSEVRRKFGHLGDFLFNLECDLNRLGIAPKDRQACEKKLNELNDIRSDIVHCNEEEFCNLISSIAVKVSMPPQTKAEGEYAIFLKKLGNANTRMKKMLAKAKELFGKSLSECEAEDALGQGLVIKLLQIVKEIRLQHQEFKKEENKSDFEDVERYVLRIFENDTICKEFSEGIDHIFLDEYQDTNRLQEAIFQKIARNNRFLVGDLKQAIYGFREADPQIFQELLELYKNGKAGENVPLSVNFRSDQKILTFVDDVFSEVMTYDFGGIDYKEHSTFGEEGLPKNTNGAEPLVEVAVFTPEDRARAESDTEIYSVKKGRRKNKGDKECDLYVADKIEEMVGNHPITDKNGERKIKYSDICVLYRTKTHVQSLTKVFEERGIPYVLEGMEGLSGSRDLDAINCYLRAVDNFRQDKYLVGAMLSYVGGFNEAELAEIRAHDYSSEFFHEAVMNYEGALKDKVDYFFEKLERHRKLSALLDVPTLIGTIMTESGYVSALLAEGKNARIAIYNSFIQTLRSKKFAKSLSAYIEFLDSEVEMELPSSGAPLDAVTIMTVHRSKGLEFPVVFVARVETSLNKKSGKQPLVLDSAYGIGINVFDDNKESTTKSARRVAIENAIYLKQNVEALRLMYVAFTRAKYRLYVVGSKNVDPSEEYDGLELPSEKESFMDWVVFASKKNPGVRLCIDPQVNKEKKEAREGDSELIRRAKPLDFEGYEYAGSTAISNKYTVTGLNTQSYEPEEVAYIPTLGSQSIQKGVAYHKVMELIDFNLRSEEEIGAFIKSLEEQKTIESGVVEARVIAKGVAHPLFDKARGGNCLREQEFIYYAPASEVLGVEGVGKEDRVLVQGIMDLVIEGEENILVDYKVSGSPIEELRVRYGKQIALYARAYEEMTGKVLHKKAVFVLNRGVVIEF